VTAASGTRLGGRPKLLSIDDILDARPQKPMATTRDRGWTGVTLDLHRPYFNCAESYPGLDHHVICYHPSGSARLVQRRAGTVHEGVIKGGVSLVMPAGYDSAWEGESGLSARFRIPPSLITAAAEQLGPCATTRVEIRNEFEVRDPVLERLARALLAELDLKPHPAQVLLIDSISMALAAHMLRQYNAFEAIEDYQVPALGKQELARLVTYVEDNLDRVITLAELAGVVNVSRFHFTRLFKRSTGFTAIKFVEQCRIRRAQALISETDLPLVDIALITGFADQSHFTRRFHRQVGCTPAAYARQMGSRRQSRRRLN